MIEMSQQLLKWLVMLRMKLTLHEVEVATDQQLLMPQQVKVNCPKLDMIMRI